MDYKKLRTMYTYAQLYLENRISAVSCKESREEYREEMEEITDLFMELNDKTARKKSNRSGSFEKLPDGRIKRHVHRR